ncbi:MAG TPA: MFS transporter [Candidatus Dormibacteraeota bacterium]
MLTVSAALALSGAGVLGVAVPAGRGPLGGGGPLLVAAYAIPLGLMALVSGHLADRAGAGRLLRIGLLGLAGASLLCSLAWNLPSLVVLRVLQGAAAGLLPATALALLLRGTSRRRLGEALGAFAAGALLLPAAAPLLGAALAGQPGWRALLAAEAAAALLAARASMAVLPSAPGGGAGRLDVAGLASGGAALLLALLALGGGSWWGWGSPLTVLLGLGGAAAVAGLVVVELSAERPLLDLRRLCDPAAGAATLLLAVLVTCLGAGFLEAPSLHLQAQGGGPQGAWSPLLAGLAAAVALPLSGRLCDRIGPRWPAAAGLSLLADASYLLHLTRPATAGWEVAALVALRGAGMGLALAPVLTMAVADIAGGAENRAAAAVVSVLRLPAAIGLAVLAGLSTVPRRTLSALDPGAMLPPVAWGPVRALLLVTAGVAALGVLLALRLPTAPAGASRVDLAGLLAALTGTRRRELDLTGVDARRPERAAATPAAPRPRRPRPATGARAATSTTAASRTRTPRSTSAATRAAKGPVAPATRTAPRSRRAPVTAAEPPAPQASPASAAGSRPRPAAAGARRRRPAPAALAGELADAAPASPARRSPARRRTAETGPAA